MSYVLTFCIAAAIGMMIMFLTRTDKSADLKLAREELEAAKAKLKKLEDRIKEVADEESPTSIDDIMFDLN
jgi:hypothetical protein